MKRQSGVCRFFSAYERTFKNHAANSVTEKQERNFKTHQFHFFFLGCPVLVAPIDGYVIHSRQDPGNSHLAILSFVEHLLPENIPLCPQIVLLPDEQNFNKTQSKLIFLARPPPLLLRFLICLHMKILWYRRNGVLNSSVFKRFLFLSFCPFLTGFVGGD